MKKIVVAIPHSHTWFWTQTCLASLQRYPPHANHHKQATESEGLSVDRPSLTEFDVEVVVVDNSPWSPAILGVGAICKTPFSISGAPLSVLDNYKSNKFHASALDCVVERYDFDYLMALETDVLALRPTWLQWFVDQMRPTDYAVGMWHHEKFVNPSCTLYRGDVLRDMARWCNNRDEPHLLRWGDKFSQSQPLDERTCEPHVIEEYISWVSGPFAEKRGWPDGTVLKEMPSGQLKGPGWFEPGQALHHWAVEAGYTYTVCRTHTHERQAGLPVQTSYGNLDDDWPNAELSLDTLAAKGAETAHMWGGTRALDIIKHDVTCQFVKAHTPYWLKREAMLWRQIVPPEVQEQTLELIRRYGWHITGQGADHVSQRDKEAAEYVRACYREGRVEW